MRASDILLKSIRRFEGFRGKAYQDAKGVEMMPLIILGIALVGFGIFPQLLMGMVGTGTEPLLPLLERIADAPAFIGGIR